MAFSGSSGGPMGMANNPFAAPASKTPAGPANPFSKPPAGSTASPFTAPTSFTPPAGPTFGPGAAITSSSNQSATSIFAQAPARTPSPFANPTNSSFAFPSKPTNNETTTTTLTPGVSGEDDKMRRKNNSKKPQGKQPADVADKSQNPKANGSKPRTQRPYTPKIATTEYAQAIYDALAKAGLKEPELPATFDLSNYELEQGFNAYKSYREDVRAVLIKAGLIDDPEVRKRLEDAIDFKGICEDMCPDFEVIDRVFKRDVPRQEYEVINNKRQKSRRRFVKALARSAAGQEAPLPQDIRSAAALKKSLEYLFSDVLNSDEVLPTVHNFLWDRTRAVRRDFVFHSTMSEEDMAIQVWCLETLTRFHVISLHLLSQKDFALEDFSQQQELEQLGKTLLSLVQAYDDCNQRDIPCENEPEFRAYSILLNAQDPDFQSKAYEAELKPWVNSSEVQLAFYLVEKMTLPNVRRGPFKDKKQGKKDSTMTAASADAVYHDYFAAIERTPINYTMACFAEIHFNHVRRQILVNMRRSYAKIRVPPKDVTREAMKDLLHFDHVDEAVEFVEKHDFYFTSEGANHEYMFLGKSDPVGTPPIKHLFSNSLVESKRGKSPGGGPRSITDCILSSGPVIGPSEKSAPAKNNDGDSGMFVKQAPETITVDSNDQPQSNSPVTQSTPSAPFATQQPLAQSSNPSPFAPQPSTQAPSIFPSASQNGFPANSQPAVQSASPFAAAIKPAAQTPSPFASAFSNGAQAITQPAAASPSPFAPAFPQSGQKPSPFATSSQPAGPGNSPFASAMKPAEQPSPFAAASNPAPQTSFPSAAALKPVEQPSTTFPATQTEVKADAQPLAQASNPFAAALKPAAQTVPPPSVLSQPAVQSPSPFASAFKPVAPSLLTTEPLSQAQTTGLQAGNLLAPHPAISAQNNLAAAATLVPPSSVPTASFSLSGLAPAASSSLAVNENAASSAPASLGPKLPLASANPMQDALERAQRKRAQELASMAPASSPKPLSRNEALDGLTNWYVKGDGGLLHDFTTSMVGSLLQEVFQQHKQEEEERTRKEEDDKSWAEALEWRRYNLGLKFFYRWRENARQSALNRRAVQARESMKAYQAEKAKEKAKAREEEKAKAQRALKKKRAAEEEASSMSGWSRADFETEVRASKRRRQSQESAEAALLSSGIFGGIDNEQQAAASAMNHGSSSTETRSTSSTPPTRLSRALKSTKRGFSNSVSHVKNLLNGGDHRNHPVDFRNSLPAQRLSSNVRPSSTMSRSMSPAERVTNFSEMAASSRAEKRRSQRKPPLVQYGSGLRTHWRLRNMGMVQMPDNSYLHESLAEPLLAGKRLPGIGNYGVPSLQSASTPDLTNGIKTNGILVDEHDAAAASAGSSPANKRKRAADDDESEDDTRKSADAESAKRRKSIEDDLEEMERIRREFNEAAEALDSDRDWMREQRALMEQGISPWG